MCWLLLVVCLCVYGSAAQERVKTPITPGGSPLDTALLTFEPSFRTLLKNNWPQNVLSVMHNITFTFSGPSLSGSLTFHWIIFLARDDIEKKDGDTKTFKENELSVNYNYRLRSAYFSTLYEVVIGTETMEGSYSATFEGFDLEAYVRAKVEPGGVCEYGTFFYLSNKTEAMTGRTRIQSGFRDPDLTRRADLIVNTFIVKEMLINGMFRIPYRFYDFLSHPVNEKVGDEFRKTINQDLCDFLK